MELVEQLQSLYEHNSNVYANKNDFLTSIIKLGLINSNKGKSVETDTTQQQLVELKDFILSLFETLETMIHKNNKMLSCVYHILYGEISGQEVLIDLLEEGFYDAMPYRIENVRLENE